MSNYLRGWYFIRFTENWHLAMGRCSRPEASERTEYAAKNVLLKSLTQVM